MGSGNKGGDSLRIGKADQQWLSKTYSLSYNSHFVKVPVLFIIIAHCYKKYLGLENTLCTVRSSFCGFKVIPVHSREPGPNTE